MYDQGATPVQTSLKGLRPEQVAVVLVDFQNDFCHPKARGDSIVNKHNAETAMRANDFAGQAKALGVHVIYTQQLLDLDRLDERQRQWEKPDGLCAAGSWGAELFIKPVAGSAVVTKDRFDIWRSDDFRRTLDDREIEGLIIAGVELCCCVLYAVLGAEERGYRYVVPQDLISGLDTGDATYNLAVRDYLRYTHNAPESATPLLEQWRTDT